MDLKELQQLQDDGSVFITINGEDVRVRPFTFGKLLKALTHLAKIPDSDLVKDGLRLDEFGIFLLLANHHFEILNLISLSTDKPIEYFENIQMDEGLSLAIAVWNVNQDFFVQKVNPMIQKLLKGSPSETEKPETETPINQNEEQVLEAGVT